MKKAKAIMVLKPYDVAMPVPLNDVLTLANDIANSEVKGIPFMFSKIDEYIIQKGSALKYLKFETQLYPSSDQMIVFIKTIPSRVGEEEFKFYFAVNRA